MQGSPGNVNYMPIGPPVNVKVVGSPIVSDAEVFPERYGPLGFIPPPPPIYGPYPYPPYPPYPPRPYGYTYDPIVYPYPY